VLESVAAIVTLRWAAAALVLGIACGLRVCLKSEITKGHIYLSKSVSIEDGMEASEDNVTSSAPPSEDPMQNGDTNEQDLSPVSCPQKNCPWNPLDPCKHFIIFKVHNFIFLVRRLCNNKFDAI
jgi:hypothetical protein